ncbi:hypothetical protein PRIPAC_86471 [Pristionchus pacificus]|nr:hypothetical protein PRIPAC_86471 [Pristionchus pacificus]
MRMIQPVQQQNYFMRVNGQHQSTVALPPQEMIEYTISPSNIVLFHGRHFLSTLYQSTMTIDNFNYPSVEHYYQACKLYTLAGSESAKRISGLIEASQCKSVARNILNAINVPKGRVEAWRRTDAPEILLYACVSKFAQSRELREKLLNTGDALLVHTFEKDNLYAVGMSEEATKKWAEANNGKKIRVPRYFYKDWFVQSERLPTYNRKGRNILGVMLMAIREAFRPEGGRADPQIIDIIDKIHGPRY